MKEIVLTRIDDRLIHGQVMTSWLNYTSANKIMVVDDEVANDTFMKSILKSCVPANIKLAVFNVETAVARLKKGFVPTDRVILLVKFPKTIHDMIALGVTFDKINIGGMGAREGRSKLFKNISASEEEKKMLKDFIDHGCKVTVQIIAEDNATDVAKIL